jgi:multidrug efflux pump subunit AcrA (membrane-fusion protein)
VEPAVSADDWCVVAVLPHMAAVLAHGALLAEGVEAQLGRDALGAVYGLDSGGHATRVLVRAGDAVRARELLADLDT